jgi:hypothetical protein
LNKRRFPCAFVKENRKNEKKEKKTFHSIHVWFKYRKWLHITKICIAVFEQKTVFHADVFAGADPGLPLLVKYSA